MEKKSKQKEKNSGKNIGLRVDSPMKTCNDKKCPFHGELKVRKKTISGILIAKDVHNSATIEISRRYLLRKFERYERRRSRIRVHNPSCIGAEKGDIVLAAQCRPLSKTKHFVIVQILGKDVLFSQKEEAQAEARVKEKEKKETKKEEDEQDGTNKEQRKKHIKESSKQEE